MSSQPKPKPDSLKRLPMRRGLISLTIAFALGIAAAGNNAGYLIAGTALFVIAGLSLMKRASEFRYLLWLIVFFGIGFTRGAPSTTPPIDTPTAPVILVAKAKSGWALGSDKNRVEVSGQTIMYQPDENVHPFAHSILLTVFVSPDCPLPALVSGARIRTRANIKKPSSFHNPGMKPQAQHLTRRGIQLVGVVADSCDFLVENPGHRLSFTTLAQRLRWQIQSSIQKRNASNTAKSVFVALATGDSGLIQDPIRQSFARSGLSHLLAISGLHLGCVALGLYGLFGTLFGFFSSINRRYDGWRIAAGLVIPIVVFYVLVAGARIPAIRACVMVALFLFARMLYRRWDPLQTLSLAGIFVLGLWPTTIDSISFQLSFAAALSVILLTRPLARACAVDRLTDDTGQDVPRKVLRGVGRLLLISLAATLGTAPLIAMHFNQLGLLGVFNNLWAVPITAWLIVPLALLGGLILPVWPQLAHFVMDIGLALTEGLCSTTQWVAAPSWSGVYVADIAGWQVVIWYLGLAFFCLRFSSRSQKIKNAFSDLNWHQKISKHSGTLTLGCLALFVGSIALRAIPVSSSHLEVTFLDVGQGDSALIRFPGGKTMLIDGGALTKGGFDIGRRVVAPFLWSRGIRKLDMVVVSHQHPDHIGGLAAIIEIFSPTELWSSQPLAHQDTSLALASAISQHHVQHRLISVASQLTIDSVIDVEILWPTDHVETLTENERSLVLSIRYNSHSFLFTGDLERDGEKGFVDRIGAMPTSVLKVGSSRQPICNK